MMTNLLSSAVMAKTRQLLSTLASTRLLLIMFLTLTVTTNAWGETVTFTPSNCTNWTDSQAEQTQTIDGITLHSTSAANNTQLRLYSGATHTFTSTVGNITSILFTCTANGTSNHGPGKMTGDGYVAGTGKTGEWTGNSAEVTLTGGQSRCTSIVVTYTPSSGGGDEPEPEPDPVDPEVTFSNGEYTVGGAALDLSTLLTTNSTGAVTYSVTDAETTGATIEGSTFTATAAGTCTVQASQAATTSYNAITKTATITVTAPAGGGGSDDCDNPTWQLVTNVSDLAVGDEIVIAASTANYALSTTQRSSNRQAVAITKSNNAITIDENVQVITLATAADPQTSTFAFYVGTGFLYASSSSGNQLKTTATPGLNGDWYIEIQNTGVATIKAQGTNTRNVMQFNLNNNDPAIFACYSSASQTSLEIYKKECTTETTYSLTLDSDLSCVTDGSATVELNATELTNFTAATRDGFTCSGYWSAPSGGVKVLNADGTFAATSVQEYITDGKWTNEGNVTLTPRWECSNTMTLSVGTQSGGTYSLSKTSLETCDCTDNKRQVTITATPNSGYSVTDFSYSGAGTATKVSGPTVNGNNTEWVYQFNQGDNGDGTFTVTFTTIPTYTITLDAGSGTCDDESLTEASGGAGVTLPTANPPAACATDDWEFAGWWTEAVTETTTSPGELLTAGSNYKPTSNCPLYAVYSKTETTQGGGGTENVSSQYTFSEYTAGTQYAENEEHELDDVLTLTTTQCHFTSELRIYSSDAHNGYVVSNQLPGRIISIGFNAGNNSDEIAVYGSTDGDAWTDVGHVSVTSTYEDYTLSFGENNYTYFKLDVVGANQVRLKSITITWESTTSGGGSTTTTTYNSNPTCLVPVWEGATIDKTELAVNCGERSSMDGAAKITFSKDKIFDFSNPITIEASEGFLVSTSRTPNENYQQYVSQSPLVGTDYPNTFNGKFVYVRAEAPAQSDTDLEGTITIKNSKGETLQTFSVTADVTCNKCTVQFVDRGANYQEPILRYAGETIDEAPADPEGVCTDPIHYVFDGWATASVAAGATTYTKVTFPYTVEGNTKFYAVYRYVEDGSADSGDYVKLTEDLDDYSGDYLIVYETGNVAFDGGRNNVDDELDATSNTIEVTINGNTIASNATTDAAKFTIAKVDDGYSIQSASGYYIGRSATSNGLSTNETYSANYDLNTITDCKTIKGKGGNILKYNKASDQKRFRYYQSGQEDIALYRKAASYLYTTSPICGPHLAITEGKEIYVTGGNAGGTRDLVIAQTKVSYKATRLEKDKSTGNLPSIKALPSNIVFDNTKTKAVVVTFDEDSVRTLQSDGTYTITGNITIAYQPKAANVTDDIQVTLNANYNPSADVSQASFTVHARSLPAEFVIVAKSGDKWYALNGDMNNGSSANPANGQVTLDNDDNPTKATYAPCNTIYTFDGLPNTGDRTYVRFQGTDGAWLWASSGTNVGIQNNVLKTTPEGSNMAYNWKLYTEDNITYRFGNANSSRQLTLNGEKFGMYASGVQDIRILPYEAKCLYNYAPINLKVSVLKGSYVTLTWDAVIGATKYQYSTDATNWTDANTEPTVTINDLEGNTEYTYYIRAYHEDTGVSQECIDYAEITFTTADCDDVPSDITCSADMTSITVTWTADAATSTVTLYSDAEGTAAVKTQTNVANYSTIFTELQKNTQYYVQVLADGTCASQIVPVSTEDVEVDIVEWYPQGIIVDINTDETVGVTLENEVSFGSGLGTEATELFFSKYYEASYNVKLVAIYNGTKNIIDLTNYTIQYGKTSWEDNYITLKDFGATKGQIQPGEEIILYSYTENNADDKRILDCVHDAYPDGNWVRVTSTNNDGNGTLSFGGDKTIILCKTEYDDEEDEYYDNIIDVIGALKNDPNEGILPTNENTEEPSWGDKEGWVCETGLSIADDSQIGISTNRCLLIRNNTVTSGENAVAQNIGDFSTLCSEWKGAQVPDNKVDNGVAASCENFAYVGTFDYSDYYTKYVPMGEGSTFDENDRNADGTVTIPITDLYKHACSNIRVKLTNSNSEVLSDREYKVPIMITTTQGTNGQTFLDLQQNLATKEVDGEGNVINTYPLSLDDVREICKTCDVVVRDNAILTKAADDAANDHPEVRDVYVYHNSSLIVPAGTNYTINNLSLRRKQDTVASLNVHPEALKLPESAAAPISLDFRLSAESWHWFTLPYDCNISEVTWIDGTPAKYNEEWFLMTYDGEKRAATQAGGCWKAYTGTTIRAGEGFILAINGNINNPAHTYELRFPMSKEVLAAEGTDKTVDVRAWGVETNIRPNHKGWNLVGNPYLAYYQRNNITNFEGLRLGQLTGPDSQTGYWEQTGDVPYVVVPVGAGWIAYEQVLASETDLLPFTAYFVQVGNDGKHESDDELSIEFDHTKLQLSATPMPASIIQRSATEDKEPIIVGVSLTNAKGESDKTSLIIDDQYTDEYEMHADFFKWFGDYYKYYTKPVVYSLGADNGKRAFNALSEDLATQPISLGMYAAQAGNYTFTLDRRSDLSKVQEVWLYDATQDKYTNLMQDSYTFNTAKTESAGRFSLSVKMAPKVSTDINNVTNGTIWATTQDHTIFVNGLLSNAQLWIYDATGKLLHADHTTNYQHSYSVPTSGVYFVRVNGKTEAQTIKVVVE